MALTTEQKLQSDIVVEFSHLYPDKRGQLFHVPNERITKSQLFIAKSIGIFSGISDMIFADTTMVFIELKVKGSEHDINHVQRQVDWGNTMESLGHVWRLCTDVESAISCTEHNYKGLTTNQVQDMIDLRKGKTKVKF